MPEAYSLCQGEGCGGPGRQHFFQPEGQKGCQDEIQNGISCLKMVLIPVFKNQAFWVPGEQISSCWGQ